MQEVRFDTANQEEVRGKGIDKIVDIVKFKTSRAKITKINLKQPSSK